MLHSPCRKVVLSRLYRCLAPQRSKWWSGKGGDRACFASNAGEFDVSKWKKMDSRTLGISSSMISSASLNVLRSLQAAGYEAYFVGGCVRDLILHRAPKDFDIITTAELKQVKQNFRRARIVGQRFPICWVHSGGLIVEVSSFRTAYKQCGRDQISPKKMPRGCDPRDFLRWKDCMKRDFTVNSLFFDPSQNVIFDYVDALKDLRSLKLRTVIPAQNSFKEDEARILRGLRFAARLNLLCSKEVEEAIYNFRSTIANLCKSRIILEMNYMLSFGAAESSILLLQKFKILEFLLPFHAAYLLEISRNGFDLRSTMLMKLFFNMDQLISCDRPAHDSLWVAILAFHKALLSNPQRPLIVLAFASLLYHGTWVESLDFARKNSVNTHLYAPEILQCCDDLQDEDIAAEVSQLARQVEDSVTFLINKESLPDAMTGFSESPSSGLVFIPAKTAQKVKQLFRSLAQSVQSLEIGRENLEVNHKLLKAGNVSEVRIALGKIMLATLVDVAVSENFESGGTYSVRVMNSAEKSDVFEPRKRKRFHLGDVEVKDTRKRRLPPHSELSQETAMKPTPALSRNSLTKERPSHRRKVLDDVDKDEHLEAKGKMLKLYNLFK